MPQILAFGESVTPRRGWEELLQGGCTGAQPTPSGKWGVYVSPRLPPWTTQGCSQAPPEQWDTPTPYCAMQDRPPGLSKGKRETASHTRLLGSAALQRCAEKEKEKKKNNFIFSNKTCSRVTVALPCPDRSKYTQKYRNNLTGPTVQQRQTKSGRAAGDAAGPGPTFQQSRERGLSRTGTSPATRTAGKCSGTSG